MFICLLVIRCLSPASRMLLSPTGPGQRRGRHDEQVNDKQFIGVPDIYLTHSSRVSFIRCAQPLFPRGGVDRDAPVS